MKRILLIACVLSACSKTDEKTAQRLAALEKRVEVLEKRPAGAAQRPQPPRPDPSVTYFVPVTSDDPVRGPATAKVTVVEAFDFACPWCAKANSGIEAVLGKYKDSVRVVSKYYVIHDNAMLPAQAACAAGIQGKGAEMQKAIWDAAWKLDPPPKFAAENLNQAPLEELAKGMKLDLDRFKKDMAGTTCAAMIERHRKEITSIGVTSTPAFYINGKYYSGPRTVEGFGAAVEAEIQKADAAVKNGVKPDEYYASLMASAKKSL